MLFNVLVEPETRAGMINKGVLYALMRISQLHNVFIHQVSASLFSIEPPTRASSPRGPDRYPCCFPKQRSEASRDEEAKPVRCLTRSAPVWRPAAA